MSSPRADIFLLAAGFGKRLGNLTEHTPKPLIKVGGRPLIEWNLDVIARSGFKRVIINLHHLGDQIRSYVGDGKRYGLDIEYSEEPILLDTGGGIKNIEDRLRCDNLITINSDILIGPDFDLRSVLNNHVSKTPPPVVTMVLRPDPGSKSYGEVGIDEFGEVCTFLGREYRSSPSRRLMFLGIQVLSKEVFRHMPKRGTIFSITQDTLVELLTTGKSVNSVVYEGYWSDLGTPERLEQASKEIGSVFSAEAAGPVKIDRVKP